MNSCIKQEVVDDAEGSYGFLAAPEGEETEGSCCEGAGAGGATDNKEEVGCDMPGNPGDRRSSEKVGEESSAGPNRKHRESGRMRRGEDLKSATALELSLATKSDHPGNASVGSPVKEPSDSRKHDSLLLACLICDALFDELQTLQAHMESVHQSNAAVRDKHDPSRHVCLCSACVTKFQVSNTAMYEAADGYRSCARSYRPGHSALPHRSATDPNIYKGNSSVQAMPFTCPDCNTAFISRDAYAMHVMIRAREKSCKTDLTVNGCMGQEERDAGNGASIPGAEQQEAALSETVLTEGGKFDSRGSFFAGRKEPVSPEPPCKTKDFVVKSEQDNTKEVTPAKCSQEGMLHNVFHNFQTSVKCLICAELFPDQDSLAMHVMSHHAEQVTLRSSAANTGREQRKGGPYSPTYQVSGSVKGMYVDRLPCNRCGYLFGSKSSLAVHLLSHCHAEKRVVPYFAKGTRKRKPGGDGGVYSFSGPLKRFVFEPSPDDRSPEENHPSVSDSCAQNCHPELGVVGSNMNPKFRVSNESEAGNKNAASTRDRDAGVKISSIFSGFDGDSPEYRSKSVPREFGMNASREEIKRPVSTGKIDKYFSLPLMLHKGPEGSKRTRVNETYSSFCQKRNAVAMSDITASGCSDSFYESGEEKSVSSCLGSDQSNCDNEIPESKGSFVAAPTTEAAVLATLARSGYGFRSETRSPGSSEKQMSVVTSTEENRVCEGSDGVMAESEIVKEIQKISGTALICRHCAIIFLNKTLYHLHMGMHNVNNPWQCNICGKICNDVHDFSAHVIHF